MTITVNRNVTSAANGIAPALLALRDQANRLGKAFGEISFADAWEWATGTGVQDAQGALADYIREIYTQLQTEEGTQALRQSLLAQYQLVDGSITLYMPPTAVYTNAIEFEDVGLTGIAKGRLMDVVGITPGYRQLIGALDRNKEKGGILGQALEAGIETIQNLQELKGLPINPKVEILFSDIPQRAFQFDFLFSPTTSQEADTIRNIIKTLRIEAAPKEIGLAGIIWKAPSTFNIRFDHNGEENLNIPKIQECVLEKIDVDYAPTGQWATFKNGFPVLTRLSLQFREREPNHQEFIEHGY